MRTCFDSLWIVQSGVILTLGVLMSLLSTARFYKTVVQVRALDPPEYPEVAFVGRSNAGKSSFINALCNHRGLAHSSRTPGRTQALNLFTLGHHHQTCGYMVDTPGYGFAAVALTEKAKWDGLAGNYMRVRECLTGAVLIVDCRRGLSEQDQSLIDWIPSHVPILIALNKSDKLSKQEQATVLRQTQAALQLQGRDTVVQLFSSLKKQGVEAASQWVISKMQVAQVDDPK
jgi:GTP-binding protein